MEFLTRNPWGAFRFVAVVAVLAPSLLVAATFGDPRGFLASEQVSETVIYPGVKYTRADGIHTNLPMVTHVVTIDLTNQSVKLQMLPGERLVTASSGQFFRRSWVSHMQKDNNALVAINGAFFDISATMTPTGLHVRDKMVLHSPSSHSTFAVTDSGLPFIASFAWTRTIRRGSSIATLQGVNANAMGNNDIVLYQYPWDRSPASSAAFMSNRPVTEVVFQKVSFTASPSTTQRHVLRGKVLEVRTNGVSFSLNATNFVLTALGTNRTFLQQMTVGSTVDVDWLFTGLPTGVDWNRVSEAVTGNNLLIVNGVLRTGSGSHWETRHPRTAVGINQQKTRVLFVLVEGRMTGRAEGMSLDSLRDYMKHMGVYNGLEFDGGGSSAMAGRVAGTDMLLSSPSGGVERYVPSGLGVIAMPDPTNSFFQNVRVSAEHNAAAISWETPQPATSWVIFGKEGYSTESIRNYELSTRHTVFLHGLEPHTLYFLRMVAQTSSGKQTSHGLQVKTGVEVIVDDTKAAFADTWSSGTSGVPYGSAYRWSNVVLSNSPTHTATFRPAFPVAGTYDVQVWYTPGSNRTPAARYSVEHQTGTILLTQSQVTGGNAWTLLATNLAFQKGTNGYAQVRNDSTVGSVVIADAFRWALRNPTALPIGEVPEWWRQHFFGTNGPVAHLDPDGDGFSLYQEYIWGTVPNDVASRPRTIFERVSNQTLRLTFAPFRSDRVYGVETSASLTTWTAFNVPVRQESGNAVVDLPIAPGSENRFYRLRVALP